MERISVELVPRFKETFLKELELVKTNFPSVDTINIPDIIRYEIPSLDACGFAKPFFPNRIPHLRACTINKNEPLLFREFLLRYDIKEVLVVLGDSPPSVPEQFLSCVTIDLIEKLRREVPEVKTYAGIDQYRSNLDDEYEYIQKKIDAGAEGFFTQPFFDLKLIELYSKKLRNIEVFWGVSPVTSNKSKHYWESKNNVIFPDNFRPTLEWNKEFAKKVLNFTKINNSHIYFMPIKTGVVEYLTGII